MTEGTEEDQPLKISPSKTTKKVEKRKRKTGKSKKSKKTLFPFSNSIFDEFAKSIKSEGGYKVDRRKHHEYWNPPWLPDISNLSSSDHKKRFPGYYVRLAPLLVQPATKDSGKSKGLKIINKPQNQPGPNSVFHNIIPDLDTSNVNVTIQPKRFPTGAFRQSRIIEANRKKYKVSSSDSDPLTSVLRKKSKRKRGNVSSSTQDFSEARPDAVQLYRNEVFQCYRRTPPFLKYWNQHCKYNTSCISSKASRLSIVCVPYSKKESVKSSEGSCPSTSASVLSVW